MLGQDEGEESADDNCEIAAGVRMSNENVRESGAYMEFVPPWKEVDRSGEPVMDHFVSIGNVLVLDEEHMNEWLHQQDSSGDSHAFSREWLSKISQRQVPSDCKCFVRPNDLSDCCMTNTSGQSMMVDDSIPLPWVDQNSDEVPQKHAESWSYSCPSEANRSQLDHGVSASEEPLTNPNEFHIGLGALHKHQNRLYHHRHHHQSNYCTQLGSLQELEQFDLRERVQKWLMTIDRSKPDFDEIT